MGPAAWFEVWGLRFPVYIPLCTMDEKALVRFPKP